jgi:hypothetical protein
MSTANFAILDHCSLTSEPDTRALNHIQGDVRIIAIALVDDRSRQAIRGVGAHCVGSVPVHGIAGEKQANKLVCSPRSLL